MSGGTPVGGGGYMRQRHSQGYWSGGDDLEDDASSRTPNTTPSSAPPARTWTRALENFLWITSAAFAVYYGDRRSNMVSLLWSDERIRRTALHLGLVSTVVNVGLVVYTTCFPSSCPPKSYDKCEALPAAAPLLISLGFLSFCLFSYALWPIWSFLTIPLLFTLLMASMVISPYLLIGPLRPQSVTLRAD